MAAFAMLAGCSDDGTGSWRVTEGDGDTVGYASGGEVVVTPDGTFVVTGNGDASCVTVDGQCVDIAAAQGRYCDDPNATADYLLDADGNVVEAICYPPSDSGTPVSELTPDANGDITLPSNQNGAVLVFSQDSNGQPLEGDLTLDGERVVLYGNGIDETILDGNVTLRSNNARIRGVTVMGNLKIETNANNSAAAFCAVRGNLNIDANNVTVASCNVYGNVDVAGNGATLVNIGVQGEWKVKEGATCVGCFSFADDGDWIMQDSEIGEPIQCSN
ncbi:MAG: hypothetical protein R3E66_09480 [bacterium]